MLIGTLLCHCTLYSSKNYCLFFSSFDLLNSQKPKSTDLKAPLRQTLFPQQKKGMLELSKKSMSLWLPSRDFVCTSGWRMSMISLALSSKSVAELAKTFYLGPFCARMATNFLSPIWSIFFNVFAHSMPKFFWGVWAQNHRFKIFTCSAACLTGLRLRVRKKISVFPSLQKSSSAWNAKMSLV